MAGGRRQGRRTATRKTFVVLRDASATGDAVLLENSGALQALADPLRVQVLNLLAEPTAAKELAAALDRPVTSLYHHLDLLEQHGLIAVADVRKEGRALVRRYQRTADRFEVAGELAGLDDLAGVLDPKRRTKDAQLVKRIALSVRQALDDDRRDDRRLRMHLGGRLDPDRLDELGDRIVEVVTEFFDTTGPSGRAQTYEVVITAAPKPPPEGDDHP